MFPLLLHFFSSLTVIIDKMSPQLHIRNCRDACNIITAHSSHWYNTGDLDSHFSCCFEHKWKSQRSQNYTTDFQCSHQEDGGKLSFPCLIFMLLGTHYAEKDALLIVSLKCLSAFIMILFIINIHPTSSYAPLQIAVMTHGMTDAWTHWIFGSQSAQLLVSRACSPQ